MNTILINDLKIVEKDAFNYNYYLKGVLVVKVRNGHTIHSTTSYIMGKKSWCEKVRKGVKTTEHFSF